ncbi:MAG TPA: COX15/CtaA family protein [Phycisphaerae bacterium]|jgi:cytochrome c oxidase assembly protein subunit 15
MNRSVWLNRFAIALAICVCPLVFVGAGVTSKGAGMAFPDWPTSNGHLVNPPGWLRVDHQLWEHSHRLLGWTVGLLAIATLMLSWREQRAREFLRDFSARRSLVGWALATLVAICIQGVLGGLRVRMVSTPLALVHGVWGQVCLSLAVLLAVLSAPGWSAGNDRCANESSIVPPRLGLATVAMILLQLIAGAVLRHTGHGLAWHLVGALSVACMIGWVSTWVLSDPASRPVIRHLARALGVLVLLQLMLGIGAYVVTSVRGPTGARLDWLLPSVHVLVGALLLALSSATTSGLYASQRDRSATKLEAVTA